MKITKEWLRKRDACKDGYNWFCDQEETELTTDTCSCLNTENINASTTDVNYNSIKAELVDIQIKEDGIEIIYRQKSNSISSTYLFSPMPDTVWKDIYKVRNNKLLFIHKVYGKHKPAYMVLESIEFDK